MSSRDDPQPQRATQPQRSRVHRRRDGSEFPVEVTSANLETGQQAYDTYGYTGDELLMLVVRDLSGTVDTEAYPKAGVDNPIVDLFVYDVATGRTTRIDVRDGKPFTNDAIGHYVYGIRWAPQGELLFNRTNRRQQIMELVAADPVTGEARVVVREEWLTGWADNSPEMRLLADGRFASLFGAGSLGEAPLADAIAYAIEQPTWNIR